MPVILPNPKLFKPHIPKAIDRHFLFGTKFFKVHQFRDRKWSPECITHQYHLMANCLKKNLQYRKFRLTAQSQKQVATAQHLRQECWDGRTRLKNAYLGDLTAIRRILMKRKDLQRKYKSMPLHTIMESCDQETFLRRKENDRLKYQLKILSKNLEHTMIEQSKIEDRIKYSNEFVLQTELDAKLCRKNLKNSLTRIRAYKVITRTYQNMLALIAKDDIYLESVLDSIENDIAEQQNFIQQIILLGVPAKAQYNKLDVEFKLMEEQSRHEQKANAKYVSNVRRSLLNLQKQTKSVVRNYVPIEPHNYVRTTPSLKILQSDIETLERTINEIRLVTMSPDAETIQTTLETFTKNIIYFDKKNRIDDKYKEILGDKYRQAIGEISLLTHNNTPTETENLQSIQDLKLQIKFQQKLQSQYNENIVDSGNMLHVLNFSLWNITDVLRHIGKKADSVSKEYPNIDLKLPLLKFDFLNLKAIAPMAYDIKSNNLMALAKMKITQIVKCPLYKAITTENDTEFNIKKYNKTYLKSIEDDETMVGRLSVPNEMIVTIPVNYGNILTRKNIKDLSAKLVEKNLKKDTE